MLQPPLRQPTQSHVPHRGLMHRSLAPPIVPREAIEQAVIQVFGIAYRDLRRTTRGRAKVALARQVAMYLAQSAAGCRSPRRAGSSSAIAPRSRMPAASSRTAATIPFSIARSISSSGPCRRSTTPPLHAAQSSQSRQHVRRNKAAGREAVRHDSFNADESPIAVAAPAQRPQRRGDDLAVAVRCGRTAARRFLVRADDAAHDDQLVVLVAHATRAPPRRGTRFGGRHARQRGSRCRARAPRSGGGRTRAMRGADRRLLPLEGSGRGGARWPAGRSARPRSCCNSR